MKPLSYFAVTGQQVANHPVKIIKLEATLNASATAGLFLQVHDWNDPDAAPDNGTVPVKSWPAIECGYKEFEMGELRLASGLYVCLSTTAATKTLATGGSDKCDILSVELTDPEQPASSSFAGDLSSAVGSLTVWNDDVGNVGKRLLMVEVNNNAGADRWLMLFADVGPADGRVPIATFPIAIVGTTRLHFGAAGREVKQTVAGVDHYGCVLMASADAKTLSNGNFFNLRAEYK